MQDFYQWLESAALTAVYHATTAVNGRLIEQQRLLKPQSQAGNFGNWGGGLFGGNPSNPDLVYCTIDRNVAVQYAQDICRRAKTNEAALITAIPDLNAYVPDEDAVFDWTSNSQPADGPVALKVWTAYAQAMSFSQPDQAYRYFHNIPDLQADRERMINQGENPDGMSMFDDEESYMGDGEEPLERNNYQLDDAQLADDMKTTAEVLLSIMTPQEKQQWIAEHPTAAFSKPLHVVKVEYFNI